MPAAQPLPMPASARSPRRLPGAAAAAPGAMDGPRRTSEGLVAPGNALERRAPQMTRTQWNMHEHGSHTFGGGAAPIKSPRAEGGVDSAAAPGTSEGPAAGALGRLIPL